MRNLTQLLQELGIRKSSFYKYLKACNMKPSRGYTEEQIMVLKQYQSGVKKNPPVRRFKLLVLDEDCGRWYVKRIVSLSKSKQLLKDYTQKGYICKLKEVGK